MNKQLGSAPGKDVYEAAHTFQKIPIEDMIALRHNTPIQIYNTIQYNIRYISLTDALDLRRQLTERLQTNASQQNT